MVANWLVASGLVANVVRLDVNSDIDADNLRTNGCTVYYSSGDMRNHKGTFENFPKLPEGGFTMIAVKEGSRVRQFYSSYNSKAGHVRYEYYNSASAGSVWSAWTRIDVTT